jgi:hypothetical protein
VSTTAPTAEPLALDAPRSRARRRPLLAAGLGGLFLALAVVIGLNGCRSSEPGTGIRIGDETLAQFQPGQTSEKWVLAVLGKPTSESRVEGEADVRVLKYATVEDTGGFFASLFGSSRKTVATIYFVVRGGTVERFWADRAGEKGLLGGEKEKAGEKKE